MTIRRVARLALLGPSLVLTGLGADRVVPPAPANVLIITLDTTRADVLTAYGGTIVETPAIDRLAREGTVFEQASTTVPLTLPAHSTLFTGLFPHHHGVHDNTDAPLGRQYPTLGEMLRPKGFHSAAFVASAVLDGRRGLARGFDTYSEGHTPRSSSRLRRRGDVVTDEAIDWIGRQRNSPFFAWVHLYDAHAPYKLPEPYRTMYADAPYLGAMAFMDAQIQRLLRALEREKVLAKTLVVVLSDHGESLGEHGEDGHGILLYQSTLHVPLIIKVPGLPPNRVVDPVRLVDVMPTVLDTLGYHGMTTDGMSLLPLMNRSAKHVDLEVYAESMYPRRFGWSDVRSLRSGRFKLVSAPRPELYDLETDPGEQRNLYAERQPLAAAMQARIASFTVGATDRAELAEPESIVRLAALGYVGVGGVTPNRTGTTRLNDPKDCIGVYNAIGRLQFANDDQESVNDFAFARPGTMSSALPSSCLSQPFLSAMLNGTAFEPRAPRTGRTLHATNR